MKVLIIGPFSPPVNGCSNANDVLLRELLRRHILTDFIDTNSRTNHGNHGKFGFVKVLSFLHVYSKVLKISAFDVVYVTPGQTFFGVIKYAPFLLLCLLLNKPYAVHVHGSYLGEEYIRLHGLKKKIFKFLLTKASAGIVLSPSLKRVFHELLPNEKIYVVENFVEDILFERELTEKADKLRILFLSNLIREKGILELLNALQIINDTGIDFETIIAGSIEPDLERSVDVLINKLGGKAQYVGTILGLEKCSRLIDSNILILPTYYRMEGQPVALLEGLATGNIIVTTNHAGIRDVISEENGFLVRIKSAEDIALCLMEINNDLQGMVKKYAVHNRMYALENFTASIFISKILNILYAIAEPGPI